MTGNANAAHLTRYSDCALPAETWCMGSTNTRNMGTAILACWQGRLTPEQRREHEALRTAGAVVLVGNAVEVVQELERLAL